MRDFEDYNNHTEALIRWLLARLTEDEVLAGAVRAPLGCGGFTIWSIRDNVNDYRRAVHRVASSGRATRWFWLALVRYHAFCLRRAGAMYADRGGFNRAWLRAATNRCRL